MSTVPDSAAATPGKDGSTGEANDRDEYPRVDESAIPDEPISDYAAELAFHPNQRRAAITTGAFGDDFQLYVVQRVADETSVADAAWRITDSDGIAGAMEWTRNNRLEYDDAFKRYRRKLPPSHKVFDRRVVEEVSFEGVNGL